MPASPNPDCTELLYRALSAPIGIAVQVSDAARCKAELYKTRTLLCDTALAELSIRTNPLLPSSELWLMRAGAIPSDVKGAKPLGKASPQLEREETR
jgi:hypothetical protein